MVTAVSNLTVADRPNYAVGTHRVLVHNQEGCRGVTESVSSYDPFLVAGPNPNNLRMNLVDSPTTGVGVYIKPHIGRTKVGSTGGKN